MNTQLNKEVLIKARELKSEEDFKVFEDIANLASQGFLTIEDFDTLCNGFFDDTEDFDFLSEGLTECLNQIMGDYPVEIFAEKLVNAVEIFNPHALLSYGFILSQWFIDEEKRNLLCRYINTKNEDIKELCRKVLTEQMKFYNNYDGLGYMAGSANKVLQGIK
ncbi:hypothetical protein [Emticicia sp. BO119]|uniref:hypothetical protein n=1 Tax=Emticicia sp. BO119 TaxID=2757768 RepID=UPI0015F0E04C|nr:hypothetical protein [Emticicia sp. BO119]MBA4852311.1 hypothetical protein [Emticicia sp. BO119]